MTFRSGADVNMDIGVSGFGPESAIDPSMVMVSVVANDGLRLSFSLFYKRNAFIENEINLEKKDETVGLSK